MSVDTSNRELFSNTTSSQQQQQTSTFFYPYDEAHYLVRILESDPLAFMAYTSTSDEECVREKGGPEEEDVMYINTSGETHGENEVKDIYNNNNNNDDNCTGPSTTTATNNEFSREVIFSGFYSIGYKPYEVRPSYFGTSNNRGMYEREKENYFLQQQKANKNKRDSVDNLGDDIDYYGNNEEKGSDDDEYHLVLSPNDLARTPLGLEFGYLKTVDYTDSADDWESEPSDGEDVMGGDGEEDEELDFSDDDDMTSFIDDEEGCIFRAPGTSGVNNNDEIIDDEIVEQKAMDKRRERQMRLIKQGRLVPQAKGPFGNLSLLDHPFHLNWDFIEQEVIQDTCSESSERAASIAVTKVSKTSDNRTNKCVDATADIEVVESRNREELLKHHIKQWTSCNKRGRLTTFAVDLFPRLLEKQLFQTGLATKDNISEVLLAKAEIVKDECAILDKIVKNLSEDDSTIVTSDGLTRRELAERKATIDYLRYGAPFTDEHLAKLKEQAPCTGTFQPVERQPPEEGHVSADDSPIGATALPPAAVCKTYKYYETMNQLRAKAFEVCSDVPRNKLDSNLKDHFVRFKGQWRSKDSIDPQEIEEKEREDMELCLRERERDEKFKLASIPYTDAEVLIIKEKLSQSRLLLSKMDLCQAILDCFTVVNEEDFDRDKNSNSRNNSQNRVSSVSQSVDPKDDDNESRDIRANMGLDVLRTNEDIQMTKPSSLGSTGESPTLSPQPTSRMVSLISRCFNIPPSPRSISPSSQGAVLGWDGVSPRQYHYTYNNRSASPINLSSQSKRKYIPRRVQEVIDQHFIKLGRFWRVKDSVTAEELAADEVRKSKISEGKEKERILIEEKRKLTIESCKAFGLWSNNNNIINNISNNNNNQAETEEVVDDGGGCPGDVDMEVGVSSGESAAVGCKRSREEDTQGLQYKA